MLVTLALATARTLKDLSTYEEDCQACEYMVPISSRLVHAVVVGSMVLGNGGWMLDRAVPQLGFEKGDVLVPSSGLLDTFDFFGLTDFSKTVWVMWWRPANSTMTQRRNPLFCRRLGTDPNIIALDSLHILYLGVFKAFCCSCLWALVLGDVWNVGALPQLEFVNLSTARCREALFNWYSEHRGGDRTVYELQDLTTAMMGTPTKKILATKGAETGSLVFL